MLVGGVTIARAVEDKHLSDEIARAIVNNLHEIEYKKNSFKETKSQSTCIYKWTKLVFHLNFRKINFFNIYFIPRNKELYGQNTKN